MHKLSLSLSLYLCLGPALLYAFLAAVRVFVCCVPHNGAFSSFLPFSFLTDEMQEEEKIGHLQLTAYTATDDAYFSSSFSTYVFFSSFFSLLSTKNLYYMPSTTTEFLSYFYKLSLLYTPCQSTSTLYRVSYRKLFGGNCTSLINFWEISKFREMSRICILFVCIKIEGI